MKIHRVFCPTGECAQRWKYAEFEEGMEDSKDVCFHWKRKCGIKKRNHQFKAIGNKDVNGNVWLYECSLCKLKIVSFPRRKDV